LFFAKQRPCLIHKSGNAAMGAEHSFCGQQCSKCGSISINADSQFGQLAAKSMNNNVAVPEEHEENDDGLAEAGARMRGVLSKHSKNFSCSDRAVDAESEVRRRQSRLIQAARAGDFKRTVDAVSEGADIHATNLRGQTPLMLASSSYRTGTDDPKDGDKAALTGGTQETIKFIIDAKADIEAKDEAGWTAILHACRSNQQKSVEFLLGKGSSIKARATDGKTALMLSAMESADALVLYLIKQKAQIEKKDEEGWSVLLYACQEGRRDLVKVLLDKGANAKEKAKDGTTPLMVTAGNGNLRVGKMLVKRGAMINLKSAQGMTALMLALQSSQEEFATWLLEENADVSIKNQEDLQAIDIAEMMGMTSMKNQLEMKGRIQSEEGGVANIE